MKLSKYSSFLLLLIYFGLVPKIIAQPYQKVPVFKSNVHKIIEWTRPDLKSSSKVSYTSIYNKQGFLVKHFHNQEGVNAGQEFSYKTNGQLNQAIDKSLSNKLEIKYGGTKKKWIKEQFFRGKIYRTIYFKNEKGKVLEQKGYVKGGELGDKFLLKVKTIFKYNSKDSLEQEIEYHYAMISPSRNNNIFSRKTTHHYHAKTGRKTQIVAYDFDKSIRKKVNFYYDSKGRIINKYYQFPIDQTERNLIYKYKNGKIWQIIDDTQHGKVVKVFVDGRLIRQRSYTGNSLFNVIDYEYVYY